MKDLKKTQKQSVNLQNYGKTEALKNNLKVKYKVLNKILMCYL